MEYSIEKHIWECGRPELVDMIVDCYKHCYEDFEASSDTEALAIAEKWQAEDDAAAAAIIDDAPENIRDALAEVSNFAQHYPSMLYRDEDE